MARENEFRQYECTVFEGNPGRLHVRSFLQDVLGFVEDQENAPFGLGYKLTMKRNIHCTVFCRAAATTNGRDV